MEAQLLRDMISDRDKRIEKIRRKNEEFQELELKLSRDLHAVATQAKEQRVRVSKEKAKLAKENEQATAKLEALLSDFRKQGASLRTYCKDVAKEKANDSSYVMRMQAQLCKAMHTMGITDHQMELVEKHAEEIVKYQKEQVARLTEEKTHNELKLMNELMAKDTTRRDEESVFTRKLDEISKERDAVERQIEESRDSGDEEEEEDDEDKEEEEDEEEKAAKKELMQMLTQRRMEIERLERLQEEQEEQITELEDQVREIQADEAQVEKLAKVSSHHREEMSLSSSKNGAEGSFGAGEDDVGLSAKDLLSAVANRDIVAAADDDDDDLASVESSEDVSSAEEEK
jgi:DNA repair exonuclease SbcCD ATPase subunit